jgi:hypothetical protein
VELEHLLDIAEITNKYHFTSTESWIANIIHKRVQNSDNDELLRGESDLTVRALDVAMLLNHTELRDAVVLTAVNHVLHGLFSPTIALAVADKHSLRTLQGAAYYSQLMAMDKSTPFTFSFDPMMFAEDARLTKDQHLRLLLGYYSLVHCSGKLHHSPIKPLANGCLHGDRCQISWNEAWATYAARHRKASVSPDVISRLRRLESLMRQDKTLTMVDSCRDAALDTLASGIARFQDNLLDHFTDFNRPQYSVQSS